MAFATLAAMLLAGAVPALPIEPELPIEVVARRAARPPVPDAQLAHMRGGLRLPNGLDVAIGIDIQTRVDGVLALHTIYASEGPQSGIRVYTDGTNAPRVAPGTTVVVGPGQTGAPQLLVARNPTGPVIVAGEPTEPVSLNLLSGGPDTWLNADGQNLVAAAVDGPPVAAETGTVSLASNEGGAIVTLEADMLRVQHLIGQATGVVVANSANNRTIDSVSSINVDLGGLTPTTMAAIFAVQRAAIDAVRGR